MVKRFATLPDIECLPGQINQVLLNLIANAADATPPSGRIEIRTELVGDGRIAVEIEDDGCGIPAQALDRVFDPFYTTKAVGKGTGLGLSVSYGIVNRHGGTIRVRSEPGRGACFRVELPVRAPSEARDDGAQPDHRPNDEWEHGREAAHPCGGRRAPRHRARRANASPSRRRRDRHLR